MGAVWQVYYNGRCVCTFQEYVQGRMSVQGWQYVYGQVYVQRWVYIQVIHYNGGGGWVGVKRG